MVDKERIINMLKEASIPFKIYTINHVAIQTLREKQRDTYEAIEIADGPVNRRDPTDYFSVWTFNKQGKLLAVAHFNREEEDE